MAFQKPWEWVLLWEESQLHPPGVPGELWASKAETSLMSQELSLPVLILVQPQDQPPGRRPGPAGHAHWWQVRLHLGCLCRSGGGSCSDPCSCQEWSEKPEEGHRRLSPAPPHTGDLAHTGRLDHVLLRRWQIVLLQDEWVQWLRLQGTSQCISLSPRAIQRLEGCMINCQAALITSSAVLISVGGGQVGRGWSARKHSPHSQVSKVL